MAGILDFITSKDPDSVERRLRLAQGLSGMSTNPNAGLQNSIQGRIDGIQKTRSATSASDKSAKEAEQALRLIGNSYPDISQAIQGGFMSGKEGVIEAMKRRNTPAKSEGVSIDGYRLALSEGFKGNYNEYVLGQKSAGASKFDIDNSSGSEVGTIPQGFELFTTESGARSMRPIAGGPEAIAADELVNKNKMAQETTARTGGIVLEDIGRLKRLLKNQEVLNPVTGLTGSAAANIPASARSNAGQLASTIKGNVGFDRLQQMRDESPTGGALGAINKQEMDLLSSVLGSLDLSQSEDQLIYNLDRLETVYMGIMDKAQAYPNASKYGLTSISSSSESGNIPTWNPETGRFE